MAVELLEQQVLSFSVLYIHNRPSVFRQYKYTQVHTHSHSHTRTHIQYLALKNDTVSSIFRATVRGLTETPFTTNYFIEKIELEHIVILPLPVVMGSDG